MIEQTGLVPVFLFLRGLIMANSSMTFGGIATGEVSEVATDGDGGGGGRGGGVEHMNDPVVPCDSKIIDHQAVMIDRHRPHPGPASTHVFFTQVGNHPP